VGGGGGEDPFFRDLVLFYVGSPFGSSTERAFFFLQGSIVIVGPTEY